MDDIILVGFGGHGKSVADCIERQGKYHIVGYTDLCGQESVYTYLGTDDVLSEYLAKGINKVAICLGYLGKGNLREKIYKKLKSKGFEFPIIVDPSAIVSDTAKIEEGTFIGKGVIINAEAKVGKLVILNTRCLVEHECLIGDYSHIAVGAVLCGQVEIGEAAFVGANATVIQCIKVGARKLIPAGMTVR